MTAGLPGTGLGGLFYLVLSLLMPLFELYLTARGRSSRARWRFVLTQLAIALGIIAAMVVSATLALRLASAPSTPSGDTLGPDVLTLPALGSLAALACLLLVVRLWALVPGAARDTPAETLTAG